MLKLSKFSSGRSSLFPPLALALIGMLSLTGCSKLPLNLLTGGGLPSVAANTQIGKENSQAVVSQTTRTEIKADSGSTVKQTTSKISADSISKVTIQETPLWMVLLLILGWLLPSPSEIGRWVISIFTRKK